MDAAERLGIVGTLRALGILGSLKQLAWGQGRSGVSAISWPRYDTKIKPTYEEMIDVLLAEGRVRCAIEELATTSVGAGFYLTCAEGHEEAMQRVEYFLADVDMDGINLLATQDLWAVGNTVLWKQTSEKFEDLLRIPINTITHIKSDRMGKVSEITQTLPGDAPFKVTDDALGDLVRWTWNPIDTGLVGRGLLESYVRQGRGYKWKDASTNTWKIAYRPSLAEIIEETEDMMRTAITRYSPRFLMDLAGFDDTEAGRLKDRMNESSWMDDIVFWYSQGKDKEFTPHRLTTDPRSRLDPFIEHFRNKELITMQTPSVKLISEEGFTEASANAAVEIELRRVAGFQRQLKRKIERDIIRAVLIQPKADSEYGMDYGPKQIKAAKIRLNWGEETKPKVTFEALNAAYQAGSDGERGITREEYRKNLAKFGIELIEGVE